jgi:hypothetical protein
LTRKFYDRLNASIEHFFIFLVQKSEEGTEDFEIDMMNVLKFVRKAWDEVISNTTRNCFEKIDIIEKSSERQKVGDNSEEEIKQIFKNQKINCDLDDYIEGYRFENTGEDFNDDDVISMLQEGEKTEIGDDENVKIPVEPLEINKVFESLNYKTANRRNKR